MGIKTSVLVLDAMTFWNRMGISPDIEDQYLSAHTIADGTREFLESASLQFSSLCCLSNDVSQWSAKLRKRFGFDSLIHRWIISGDVGYRKPGKEIYAELLRQLQVEPRQILFVDDRPANLDTARSLGLGAVLFDPNDMCKNSPHQRVNRLSELLEN